MIEDVKFLISLGFQPINVTAIMTHIKILQGEKIEDDDPSVSGLLYIAEISKFMNAARIPFVIDFISEVNKFEFQYSYELYECKDIPNDSTFSFDKVSSSQSINQLISSLVNSIKSWQ